MPPGQGDWDAALIQLAPQMLGTRACCAIRLENKACDIHTLSRDLHQSTTLNPPTGSIKGLLNSVSDLFIMLLTREHVDYYSRPNKPKHRTHRMKTFSVFVSIATQSNATSASFSQLLKLGGDIIWKCGVWHVISEMSGVSAAPFCTLCWPDGGQTFGTWPLLRSFVAPTSRLNLCFSSLTESYSVEVMLV